MTFAELPKTDKRGRELTLENAVIDSISITIENHGCLDAWLHLRFKGGGIGFGGFKLGNADGGNLDENCKQYAAEFLVRCLKVGGVERWEHLKGRPVRLLHEGLGGTVVAVGHFVDDEWFSPKLEWSK